MNNFVVLWKQLEQKSLVRKTGKQESVDFGILETRPVKGEEIVLLLFYP
jgi:hypothetical protein